MDEQINWFVNFYFSSIGGYYLGGFLSFSYPFSTLLPLLSTVLFHLNSFRTKKEPKKSFV